MSFFSRSKRRCRRGRAEGVSSMWRAFLSLRGRHRGAEQAPLGTIHAVHVVGSSTTTRRSLLRGLFRRRDPIIQLVVGILQPHCSDDLLIIPDVPISVFKPPTNLEEYSWIVHAAAQELMKPPEECSMVLDDLIKAGLTLRLLMSCMERHIANEFLVFPLMLMLVGILWQMNSLGSIDAFRADESDICTLLSVVSQHQHDAAVVQVSWCAFGFLNTWELEHHPQLQPSLDNATIVLLLNSMRAFPDNVTVISCCVDSLALLVASHEGNSARIAEQGGLVEVVNAMIRFPEDLKIKKHACCFWMLVAKAREGPVPGRFEWSDAVAEVLSAMSQCRQSADPCRTYGLTYCIGFLVSAANKERIQREILARNGVLEIVAAMNCQPDVPYIIRGGIYLFSQIADSGQHDDVLLNSGALGATRAAIEQFQSDPEILLYSCDMIRYLSDPQRGLGRMLVEGGVIETLVSVFQAAELHLQDKPANSVRRFVLAALLHVVTSATNLSDEQFLSIFNVCKTVTLGAFWEDDDIGATVASLRYAFVRFHWLPSVRGLEE